MYDIFREDYNNGSIFRFYRLTKNCENDLPKSIKKLVKHFSKYKATVFSINSMNLRTQATYETNNEFQKVSSFDINQKFILYNNNRIDLYNNIYDTSLEILTDIFPKDK